MTLRGLGQKDKGKNCNEKGTIVKILVFGVLVMDAVFLSRKETAMQLDATLGWGGGGGYIAMVTLIFRLRKYAPRINETLFIANLDSTKVQSM